MSLLPYKLNPLTDIALPEALIERLVADALAEDLGQSGDVTSAAVIPETAQAKAVICARETGILAGLDFALAAFRHGDVGLSVTPPATAM